MAGRKKDLTLVMFVVVMGMMVGQSGGDVNSFRDCYAKCFIFCMIEPNKTLCTCTTQCLKECIFPSAAANASGLAANAVDVHAQNLGYCKLGCATSLCSNISKAHNPDSENVETCVGSCSNKCISSYSSSSP